VYPPSRKKSRRRLQCSSSKLRFLTVPGYNLSGFPTQFFPDLQKWVAHSWLSPRAVARVTNGRLQWLPHCPWAPPHGCQLTTGPPCRGRTTLLATPASRGLAGESGFPWAGALSFHTVREASRLTPAEILATRPPTPGNRPVCTGEEPPGPGGEPIPPHVTRTVWQPAQLLPQHLMNGHPPGDDARWRIGTNIWSALILHVCPLSYGKPAFLSVLRRCVGQWMRDPPE
jgi:hypothetical protein